MGSPVTVTGNVYIGSNDDYWSQHYQNANLIKVDDSHITHIGGSLIFMGSPNVDNVSMFEWRPGSVSMKRLDKGQALLKLSKFRLKKSQITRVS